MKALVIMLIFYHTGDLVLFWLESGMFTQAQWLPPRFLCVASLHPAIFATLHLWITATLQLCIFVYLYIPIFLSLDLCISASTHLYIFLYLHICIFAPFIFASLHLSTLALPWVPNCQGLLKYEYVQNTHICTRITINVSPSPWQMLSPCVFSEKWSHPPAWRRQLTPCTTLCYHPVC